MNLKNAFLRVSVETFEQFDEAVKTPGVELIYIDAGYFTASSWRELVKRAHKGTGGIGKLIGLRFPHIWRTESEKFFADELGTLKNAEFDCWLVRNMETALWLKENGIAVSGEKIIFDHTVYSFNSVTDEAISDISGFSGYTGTFSLEESGKEISAMSRNTDGYKELCVYGRVPMMVTAQCVRKTALRCDRRMCVMKLKDRTGMFLPVKNCCTFCCNTVYNGVPTVLFDLGDELSEIAPDFIRYEFTTEAPEEVRSILKGEMPRFFTRGHFRKGVM